MHGYGCSCLCSRPDTAGRDVGHAAGQHGFGVSRSGGQSSGGQSSGGQSGGGQSKERCHRRENDCTGRHYADQAKTLRSSGYKASVQKDGQVVYCRSEPEMDSFFETKVCDTPENILLSITNSKDIVNQMHRTPTSTRSN